MDRDIGQLVARLKSLGIDDNTIIFFTSDNGPHKEGGHDPTFFQSSGPFRGIKRDLTEGGIRVPMIVRWPGHVKAGGVSDQVWAFWDFMPTAAQMGGVESPQGIDGISMLPALLGQAQKDHDYLYWEFFEGGFRQAVRMGDWKAIREGLQGEVELYRLSDDPGETRDVASTNPAVISKVAEVLLKARTDSPEFPVGRQQKKRPTV
jgi:arylsulfatase A-like enzyme